MGKPCGCLSMTKGQPKSVSRPPNWFLAWTSQLLSLVDDRGANGFGLRCLNGLLTASFKRCFGPSLLATSFNESDVLHRLLTASFQRCFGPSLLATSFNEGDVLHRLLTASFQRCLGPSLSLLTASTRATSSMAFSPLPCASHGGERTAGC